MLPGSVLCRTGHARFAYCSRVPARGARPGAVHRDPVGTGSFPPPSGPLSPNDSYPDHVVTAVIVAHDGAEWLPRVTSAVLGQTHPVQRIVAVDTGSRDRSGAVLADLLGTDAVFGMERDTGYGEAVARALTHRAATAPVQPSHQGGQGGPSWGQADPDDWAGPAGTGGYRQGRGAGNGPAEWIWLLHDDCEPEPDALAELLRGAAETPGVAVLGPKVLDWADRRVILEVGLTIDTAGRRISGTEPREIDQGQHDGGRDVLAVSSAGMLARRDVWDEVGGFDAGLSPFREDVDFCWRVHAAGYRVRVVTDAIVYHLEASARGRGRVSAPPRPRQADRRNALIVLLANLPVPAMIAALAGNAALSAARIGFFLLAKRPQAARDEAAAFGSVLARPAQLYGGRRSASGALRSQVPRGRSVRMLAEFAAATLSPSSRAEATGSHHASDDPSDDDSLLTDSGLAQRIITNPGILLFTALLVIALVAERSLLGSGPLGGGALLPSWGGASALWGEYLAGFHTVGVGSAASTPPYIAVIAAVSTILGGKPWLAVEVILLGCVPISGVTAYLASRRISRHRVVRVWLAASYALLPAATGAVAAGRLGTAVVFMVVPVIVATAGRMLTQPRRRARRAAWATGLLIALAAAFVPLVWVVAVLIAALAALAFGRARRAMVANLAIVALVPPVLLAPWTLSVAEHPSMLLLEVGLHPPGLASRNLPASSLLMLNPGGPGTPPAWVAAGLLLAALGALLMRRRAAAAWGVTLAGLLTAIVVTRFVVMPPGGGPAVPAWPGVALLVAALGLLLAVAIVGDELAALFVAGGPRRLSVCAMAIAACAPPLLAAGYWITTGVTGPVTRVAGPVLPEFVSVSSASDLQLRTLVLRPGPTSVGYLLLRGSDPPLGNEALTQSAAASRALGRVVAGLAAPQGSDIGDAGASLAQFAIGYVLLPAPVDPGLARLLDGVVGLRAVSQTPSFELWRVAEIAARARVIEPSGVQVALPSGSVNVSGAAAPAAGGTLVLAEPASATWHAALNGRPLTALPSPVYGWAQGFRLPAGGGRIDITRDETGRGIVVALEAVALVAVGALALPGAQDSAPAPDEAGAEGRPRRASRTAPGSGRGTSGRTRQAGARRGGRGERSPGRRRRSDADEPEDTGPRRAEDLARGDDLARAEDLARRDDVAAGDLGRDEAAELDGGPSAPGSRTWEADR